MEFCVLLNFFFFSFSSHINVFRLLSAMGATSLDTEVTVVVKYFYWLARKP